MSVSTSLLVTSAGVQSETSTALGRFCDAEDGAVTVDWVVLTGALVGLGLAVMAVVSGGVENLSGDIAADLADTSITTRFASIQNLFSGDFSDGLGDWVGGAAVTLAGFGDVLQLGSGDTATLTLDVPDGASSATLSFDLIAGDDLDGGDLATVMINGQTVSIFEDDHGVISLGGNPPSGISVSVDQVATNEALGAGGHGHDSVATYTITVDDPGSSLTLGVNSSANNDVSDEFFALDNVSVTSS